MDKKVLVFGGTEEGRKVTEYLLGQEVWVKVCTATRYGGSLLGESRLLSVSHERLDAEAMAELMHDFVPDLVLDATHPYAVEVSQNIQKACDETGQVYLRLIRESLVLPYRQKEVRETSFNRKDAERVDEQESVEKGGVIYADSVAQAVSYLQTTTGNVFVTTGSKELAKYTKLAHYEERVYARVLSTASVAAACQELGFAGRHLICMQGPFSTELNIAMLRQTGAKYLVTKESGNAGGFLEKCLAAEECNVTLIIIGRPVVETGYSFEECKHQLRQRLGLPEEEECGVHQIEESRNQWQAEEGWNAANSPKTQCRISLVGIGMGNPDTMTREARRVCQEAQVIIGAGRMIEAVAAPEQLKVSEYRPEEILRYIREHPEYERIVAAYSGDTGFFSGAKALIKLLEENAVSYRVYGGISSMAYFLAKLGKSWDDVRVLSMHGRDCNLTGNLRQYGKAFVLIGTEDGIGKCCRRLTDYGMGKCCIWIGENLSQIGERIYTGKAADYTRAVTSKLSVLYIERPEVAEAQVMPGISDEAFIRGKVPMTKEEIRILSLAKLQLQRDSILYDIGAGTGSVSVEAARLVIEGKVFAIEKKMEAVELLCKNAVKFAAENLEIVEGTAPGAMKSLPVPTHAFIGGSSGNLREIIQQLLEVNPEIRIVINAITLETVSEALACVKKMSKGHADITQVSVARGKEVGNYHMMMGENPVTIIAFGGSMP